MSPDPPRSWTLHLPMTRPLSLNDRQNRWAHNRDVQQVKNDTILLSRHHRVPRLQRASVVLHYAPPDRRRRDALNLVATLKVVEDAIVAAGCLPDDCEPYLTPTMPVLDPPDPSRRTSRLHVVITADPIEEP